MFFNFFRFYKLRKNVKHFFKLDLNAHKDGVYYGWGRKKSGALACKLARKNNAKFCLLEDGLIRSLGLAHKDSHSFSLICDDVGVYYDASRPSRLENLLNSYEFSPEELLKARLAIDLILANNISKYNDFPEEFQSGNSDFILVVLQSANDLSLKYGCAEHISSRAMIEDAIAQNPGSTVLIKPHPDTLSGKKRSDLDSLPPSCRVLDRNYNPISLLKHCKKVYTKTSTMGYEALLCGCECVCYGAPFYAGWGLTTDMQQIPRRVKKRSIEELFYALNFLCTIYYNPYDLEPADIFSTINSIKELKQLRYPARLFFFGFSHWKRRHTRHFFANHEIIFISKPSELSRYKITPEDTAFIWGDKIAKSTLTPHFSRICIVEDGFIRSRGLGSNLSRAYSLVIDDLGIYFNPHEPSRLEYILKHTSFSPEQIAIASTLREQIIQHSLSKYNCQKHQNLAKKSRRCILIPAQVEDDASIRLGGLGYNTLRLIKEVRENNPDAYIIYKIHPDVLAGNRAGLSDERVILRYCDEIISDISLDSCLKICDEVHTITSTAGFEALLRGIAVHTYGAPFYAGWQLSIDKNLPPEVLARRSRALSIDELVAGALLLYPRYLNPKNNLACHPQTLINQLLSH